MADPLKLQAPWSARQSHGRLLGYDTENLVIHQHTHTHELEQETVYSLKAQCYSLKAPLGSHHCHASFCVQLHFLEEICSVPVMM